MSEYNGWTNRNTWNVNLWINNDERLYSKVTTVINNLMEIFDGDAHLTYLQLTSELGYMVSRSFAKFGAFGDINIDPDDEDMCSDVLRSIDFSAIAAGLLEDSLG